MESGQSGLQEIAAFMQRSAELKAQLKAEVFGQDLRV